MNYHASQGDMANGEKISKDTDEVYHVHPWNNTSADY